MKAAVKAKRKLKAKPKKTGRPTKRTPKVIKRILEGLSKGTPMTIICDAADMPSVTTVWTWREADPDLSEAIARARDTGFDRIAQAALDIADEVTEKDSLEIREGIEIPNKEWLLRSKLRVETRLKLLAKWDPKRYGERLTQEISGPGGGPIQTEASQPRTKDEEEAFARMLAQADREARPEGK